MSDDVSGWRPAPRRRARVPDEGKKGTPSDGRRGADGPESAGTAPAPAFDSPAEESSPPVRRRIQRWHVGVAVILALLILPKVMPGLYGLIMGPEEEEEEIVLVDVAVARVDQVEETFLASGTLLANREVELSAESSGIVTYIRIDEGSQVSEGELLVRINDNDLRAELTGVEYELEVVEAAAERQEQLVAEGGTTRDALDQVLVRLSELHSAREQLQTQIRRREIRAPFEGVVGLSHVDPGMYLTPGARIATLQALDSVRVDFSLPERYSEQVRQGDLIRFTVQGSDSVFIGEVRAVEPRVDPHTRTLRVRGAASNESGLLRPGAFADIEHVAGSVVEAVRVPAIALQQGASSYSILVMSTGAVETREVTPGPRTADHVTVLAGLEAGDTVILNGFHRLRDGSRVAVRGGQVAGGVGQ